MSNKLSTLSSNVSPDVINFNFLILYPDAHLLLLDSYSIEIPFVYFPIVKLYGNDCILYNKSPDNNGCIGVSPLNFVKPP